MASSFLSGEVAAPGANSQPISGGVANPQGSAQLKAISGLTAQTGAAAAPTPATTNGASGPSSVLSSLADMRSQAQGNPTLSQMVSGLGIVPDTYRATQFAPVNLSAKLGGGSSGGASNGGSAAATGGSNIDQWVANAMKDTGVSGDAWINGLKLIAQHESGDNPNAINNWDSNAAAGHASQGLMQTIPSTFDAYVPAALKASGIDNPVANIAAAINYINSRYGGINNVPGVKAVNAGGSYVGY